MTVNDLMNLDIEFCEKVSKMGATAWANQFVDEGSMIVKLGDNILGEVAIYELMKLFFQKKEPR
jgi:dTDP-glucose pyrophosphorylase